MQSIDFPFAWTAMTADTLPHPAAAARPSRSGPVERLDQARQGCVYTVRRVDADPRVPERSRQLEEIGFFPGERVTVMTRGFPGGDPLVVRVGVSTFALRGAEAACVHVEAAATAR